MADELLAVGSKGNKKRLKDMGDGSFAEVVSASVSVSSVAIDQSTPGTTNNVSVATGTGWGAVAPTAGAAITGQSLEAGGSGQTGWLSSLKKAITDLKSLIVLAAGEAHVGAVGGATVAVRVEKTRPNDTNAYIANDVIAESASAGTSWAFAVGRVATGSGVIVGAQVATDSTAGVARLELDLYDTDLATPLNDNAEATRLYTQQGKFLQTITFPALAKKTANSTQAEAANADVRVPFKCAGSSTIFGVLRTLDPFSTVAQAKYQVTLFAVQD